ncbi:hypothetical protein PACTADRAFT_4453 [Pachysolen tannophilus NRRL Y-2460]|uniref:Meiotically up-regulated protein Msb1/Mug8 domain-containing protein n=1 Tax=Pachysolen tannophilus NRRL Y-2460 TaxID=669874 RepID=A0A1E4TRZ3_PACTA|nr:hypothetical protein PACTADRAFT_4453 [Pachysolen tannophilus NRRL Y-2460]
MSANDIDLPSLPAFSMVRKASSTSDKFVYSNGKQKGIPTNIKNNVKNNTRNYQDFFEIVFTRDEVKDVIHLITGEIKAKGTKSELIFLPFRPQNDEYKLKKFLSRIFINNEKLDNLDIIEKIIKRTDEFTLISALKFFWCRLPHSSIIGWKPFLKFQKMEKKQNYPRRAFLDIMPQCLHSTSHASIVYDFLDLLISIASCTKENKLSGRKIAKMCAIWAFDGPHPNNINNSKNISCHPSYQKGLNDWIPASDAMFHLLLAFLRSILPIREEDKVKLPRTLRSLIANNLYPPPLTKDSDSSGLLEVPIITLTVNNPSKSPTELISKIVKTLTFENPKLFYSREDYILLKNVFNDTAKNVINKLSAENKKIINNFCNIDENLIVNERNSNVKFKLVAGWADDSDSIIKNSSDDTEYFTANISKTFIDDYFIWTWLSTISPEETTSKRNIFGRSFIMEVELDEDYKKWIVIEEQNLNAENVVDGEEDNFKENEMVNDKDYQLDLKLQKLQKREKEILDLKIKKAARRKQLEESNELPLPPIPPKEVIKNQMNVTKKDHQNHSSNHNGDNTAITSSNKHQSKKSKPTNKLGMKISQSLAKLTNTHDRPPPLKKDSIYIDSPSMTFSQEHFMLPEFGADDDTDDDLNEELENYLTSAGFDYLETYDRDGNKVKINRSPIKAKSGPETEQGLQISSSVNAQDITHNMNGMALKDGYENGNNSNYAPSLPPKDDDRDGFANKGGQTHHKLSNTTNEVNSSVNSSTSKKKRKPPPNMNDESQQQQQHSIPNPYSHNGGHAELQVSPQQNSYLRRTPPPPAPELTEMRSSHNVNNQQYATPPLSISSPRKQGIDGYMTPVVSQHEQIPVPQQQMAQYGYNAQPSYVNGEVRHEAHQFTEANKYQNGSAPTQNNGKSQSRIESPIRSPVKSGASSPKKFEAISNAGSPSKVSLYGGNSDDLEGSAYFSMKEPSSQELAQNADQATSEDALPRASRTSQLMENFSNLENELQKFLSNAEEFALDGNNDVDVSKTNSTPPRPRKPPKEPVILDESADLSSDMASSLGNTPLLNTQHSGNYHRADVPGAPPRDPSPLRHQYVQEVTTYPQGSSPQIQQHVSHQQHLQQQQYIQQQPAPHPPNPSNPSNPPNPRSPHPQQQQQPQQAQLSSPAVQQQYTQSPIQQQRASAPHYQYHDQQRPQQQHPSHQQYPYSQYIPQKYPQAQYPQAQYPQPQPQPPQQRDGQSRPTQAPLAYANNGAHPLPGQQPQFATPPPSANSYMAPQQHLNPRPVAHGQQIYPSPKLAKSPQQYPQAHYSPPRSGQGQQYMRAPNLPPPQQQLPQQAPQQYLQPPNQYYQQQYMPPQIQQQGSYIPNNQGAPVFSPPSVSSNAGSKRQSDNSLPDQMIPVPMQYNYAPPGTRPQQTTSDFAINQIPTSVKVNKLHRTANNKNKNLRDAIASVIPLWITSTKK